MSNTTDSGSDFAYEMPESIASVLASQGFSEAARVFQSIGGDAVPQAMRAQLSMALPERTVTPDDVQQEIDEMILRVGSANDPAVHQARAVLQGLVGKPMAQLKAAAAYLETLTSYGQNRQSADDETPEARINRLWARIDQAEENILEKMRKKLADGEISKTQFDEWYAQHQLAQEKQEFARSLPEGDTRREAANAAAATATAVANNTVSQYLGKNDEDVRVVRDSVDQIQSELEGYHKSQGNNLSSYRSATPDAAGTVNSAPYNPEANAPTLLDIPPAVASSPTPAANTNQPAVAPAVTASAEQPYEIADVSLGETGQFTPASTSQPGAAATGRSI